MKRVTASEARRHWFRLLDEVAAGEIVILERKGRRLVLRIDEANSEAVLPTVPDYKDLLRVPDADKADQWTWEWHGPGQDLTAATSEAS
jgi:antitoxin (DNA-binding transcriptional repressor) of toxin-antitoxin stability system